MAISDFFQALARPEVQRQLAALSYAYGPQAMDNGVASRFANYNQYREGQQNDLLKQQLLTETLRSRKEEEALKKEQREREQAARARLDESLRGADLTSSLPSLEADLAGAGPIHGAAAPPQAILPSIAKYYSDIGDYGGAVNLYQNAAEMEAQQREAIAKQQAEEQQQALIQQAISDPNVQQRLGPAAPYILGINKLPGGIAKLLAPPPPVAPGAGGAGGIGAGPGDQGPFGSRSEAERMMNTVYRLEPKARAGTITPEERVELNMAAMRLAPILQPKDPSLPPPNILGAFDQGVMPAAGAPASGTAPTAGQPQEPEEGGRLPLRGASLSQMVDDITGPINAAQRLLGRAPIPLPYRDLPGNKAAQEAGIRAGQLVQQISSDLQRNPHFPQGEREEIARRVARLDPSLWSNKDAYREELVNVGRFVNEQLDQARYTLTQNVPRETRASALAATSTLPTVMTRLGVHFANNEAEMDAAMKRAKPGDTIVMVDEQGGMQQYVVGED